ncbi:MAG: response regulator transcription factor [Luteibaculaceae bacterium]
MQILLVEDDLRLATLTKKALAEEGYKVTVANNGKDGKILALNNAYNLVITDIILPEINGVELCKLLKSKKPDLTIMMLTALGTTDEKVEGFDAGADDYLVKPFEIRELLVRVRALIKRTLTVEPNAASEISYQDLTLNLNLKMAYRGNKEIQLTPKEFKLLEFLLKNAEKVLSRTEIAEKVWDTHFDTGTNFIDVYINYLRKKIDKDFEPKLIQTKSGMGFILKAN